MRGELKTRLLVVVCAAFMAACTTTTVTTSSGEVVSTTQSGGAGASPTVMKSRARARVELAAGYFRNGQLAVALEEAKRAVQIDPTFADAYGLLGLIYMELEDRRAAEENFQRALQLDPSNSDLNNNYGWIVQTDANATIATSSVRCGILCTPLRRVPISMLGTASVRTTPAPSRTQIVRTRCHQRHHQIRTRTPVPGDRADGSRFVLLRAVGEDRRSLARDGLAWIEGRARTG
jgi:tetratricopeptide (TPR) repeat protein